MPIQVLHPAFASGVPPIELIDGEKAVEMLEDLELGLRSVQAFESDPSFFNEFRG
jgi:restriction system protein